MLIRKDDMKVSVKVKLLLAPFTMIIKGHDVTVFSGEFAYSSFRTIVGVKKEVSWITSF